MSHHAIGLSLETRPTKQWSNQLSTGSSDTCSLSGANCAQQFGSAAQYNASYKNFLAIVVENGYLAFVLALLRSEQAKRPTPRFPKKSSV